LLEELSPHDPLPKELRSLPSVQARYPQALKNLESSLVSGIALAAGPRFA
jgi:hypothetical protein